MLSRFGGRAPPPCACALPRCALLPPVAVAAPPIPPRLVGRCGATAQQRYGEPAWHRRARRKRGAARALLRVAAAAQLVGAHHSSGPRSAMPNGRFNGGGGGGGSGAGTGQSAGGCSGAGGSAGGSKGGRFWSRPCTVCGLDDNFASRHRCRNCGAYGPRGPAGAGMVQGGGGNSRWNTGTGAGGGCGGGRPGGVATTAAVPQPTLAQRQVRQQQEFQRSQNQRADAKRREDLLSSENARLKRQLAAATMRNGVGDQEPNDDMDDDEGDLSEEERKRRIDETRNGLAYLASKFGEDSCEHLEAKRELAALERASREAKPYKTHRAQLERKKDRLERQRDRAKEEAEQLQAQVDELQERIADIRSANETREQEIIDVDSELKELLRKAIADGEEASSAPQPQGPDPASAWHTVSAALESMATQPGVPLEWASQLGGMLEQLRVAALAIQHQASAAAGSTSAGPQIIGASPAASTGATMAAGTTKTSSTAGAQQETGGPACAQRVGAEPKEDTAAARPPSPTEDAPTLNGGPALPAASANGDMPAQETAGGAGGPNSVFEGTGTKGLGDQRDSDLDSDDDDMASIEGAEFDLLAGETEQDRKKRIRQHLRDREKRRAEARRKERQARRKGKDHTDNSNGPRVGGKNKLK